MKVSNIFNFLIILAVLVMSSCNSDDDTSESIKVIPEVFITASLSGTVVDEAGLPMENVTVQAGTSSSETDVFGVFTFTDIQLNQNGALVSVEKDGYFNNSKVVFTNSNSTSITKIMLIEKVVTSTFPASAGGTSITNGGAKVVIPASGVKLESGGSYSGNVNVYATWLDPTSDDISLRMPGDLRATNADDEAVKLVTYGMIGVELEGDSGEALNIADGQTATIEVPVPSSLLSSAPSTIPLWHFDEATGYWVEDGVATLTSDNTYVGTVGHFSFWNYDVPYTLIHVEGKVTDPKDDAISGLTVQISLNADGQTGYGYTNLDGSFEGYVPKDQDLTITILDGCGEEVYTGQVGPFSEDAIIPTISISSSTTNFITVIGVLTDCNNEIESDGYVYVDINGSPSSYIAVNTADGSFTGTVSVCDQMEVTISGVSVDPFSQGTTTVHDITGLTELNVGTLVTCW